MANFGKNSNNSQFYITFHQTKWLDGKFVIVGMVVDGYDTLERLEKIGSSSGVPNGKIVVVDCGVCDQQQQHEPQLQQGSSNGQLHSSEPS